MQACAGRDRPQTSGGGRRRGRESPPTRHLECDGRLAGRGNILSAARILHGQWRHDRLRRPAEITGGPARSAIDRNAPALAVDGVKQTDWRYLTAAADFL